MRANSGFIPFGLRRDFIASVDVPRDLTLTEAKRLGDFIRTLAVDFKPEPREAPRTPTDEVEDAHR